MKPENQCKEQSVPVWVTFLNLAIAWVLLVAIMFAVSFVASYFFEVDSDMNLMATTTGLVIGFVMIELGSTIRKNPLKKSPHL
jgi:membrane protein YdbS with pleckstrin-like domain